MATGTDDHTNAGPTCSNHPDVPTRLTCSNCGTPICPRCMVAAAVGQKCPACARQSSRARGTPTLGLVARVLGVTLAGGLAGGFVFAMMPLLGLPMPRFGLLILSALYGFAMGSLALWAARRRTHTAVGAAAVVGLVAGVAAMTLLLGLPALDPRLVLVYVISGGITFVRATGIW